LAEHGGDGSPKRSGDKGRGGTWNEQDVAQDAKHSRKLKSLEQDVLWKQLRKLRKPGKH
jgi:hypothetical protein